VSRHRPRRADDAIAASSSSGSTGLATWLSKSCGGEIPSHARHETARESSRCRRTVFALDDALSGFEHPRLWSLF